MLELRNLTAIGVDGRPIWSDISAAFKPGEITAIVGAVGTGKSTLLRAICGLAPEYYPVALTGHRILDGHVIDGLSAHETAAQIAYFPQAADQVAVADTVRGELAFRCEQLGYSGERIDKLVLEIATAVDVVGLLDCEMGLLAGGDRAMVNLAAALAGGADYLLLDEAFGRLDSVRRAAVIALLRRFAREHQMCIVLSAHSLEEVGINFDQVIELKHFATKAQTATVTASRLENSPGVSLISLDGLTAKFDDHVVFENLRLEIKLGEIIALTGHNATGKTTLLNLIYDRVGKELGCVMVPQQASDLLIFDTVERELRDADASADLPSGSTAKLLRSLGFEFEATTHPRDLSAGQQLGLVLALQLSRRADLLLLDEPSSSLDARTTALLEQAIRRAARQGTAVVVVTHDAEFAHAIAHRRLVLEAGFLTEVST
ncbi:MAG: ATP-binding cassette domain-containing protein [Micrococcales bacterium]